MQNEEKRIAVVSGDAELAHALLLLLCDRGAEARRASYDDIAEGELALYDIDTLPDGASLRSPAVGFSRTERRGYPFPVLRRPFPYAALLSLLLPESLPRRHIGGKVPLLLDPDSRTLYHNGDAILLSPTEYRLLALLLRRRGEAVSKEELLREAELPPSGRSLAVFITYLRKKLERDGARRIVAVRGVGYRLDV